MRALLMLTAKEIAERRLTMAAVRKALREGQTVEEGRDLVRQMLANQSAADETPPPSKPDTPHQIAAARTKSADK